MARRHAVRFVLGAVSVAALAACATLVGVDELSVGECKGGVCGLDGGDDFTPDEDVFVPTPTPDAEPLDGGPCTGNGGPRAVRAGPADNRFCIDSTEVTFAQYAAFLDAGLDAKAQPTVCAWNKTFAPSVDGGGDIPVAGVDWCDALAFCKWAGKDLCGKAQGGKKVGPVGEGDVGDYATHEWLIACSAKTNKYPYGNDFQGTACNVAENDAGRPLPVGSKKTCEGGYPGVFDMVGNVWEWYDGPCRTDAGLELTGEDGGPQSAECWLKGGGYVNKGSNIDCRVDGLGTRRDTRAPFIGIRCCSQ